MPMRFGWFILMIVVVLLQLSAPALAQPTYFTIGPKIGYTFGDQGGWTFGGEISLFPEKWNLGRDTLTLGKHAITFDASYGPNKAVNLHLGYEDVSLYLAGADVGPSLIIEDGTARLGASLIVFLWVGVIFYYEWQVFPARPTPLLETLGGYFKVPVGLNLFPNGSFAKAAQVGSSPD